MRADDIRKAEEFEQFSIQTSAERKDEQDLCDHFIKVSRQRHETDASRLKEKFLLQMINDKTAYLNSSNSFWKLDPWEDDLRRRRRLVANLNGTSHDDAVLSSSSNETDDDILTILNKEENLLKQIKQKTQSFVPNNNEDDNLSQVEEKDVEQEFSGPIRYSVECSLICGIYAIHGILSITHHAMLFDTDEDNEEFRKIQPEVRKKELLSNLYINILMHIFRYFHILIIFMENGVLVKYEQYFLDDIFYKIKH